MSFAIGGPTTRWARVSSKSANYTVTNTDEIGTLLVTTGSSANVTITLPDASENADRVLEVVKVDSGTKFVEIARAGSDTVRGSATSIYAIQQYESIKLVASGTDWVLLGDPNRTVSAEISAAPAITSQTGSWISSVDNDGSGDRGINFNTGVFLSTPYVVSNGYVDGVVTNVTNAATTGVDVYIQAANDGSPGNYAFQIMAHGPK